MGANIPPVYYDYKNTATSIVTPSTTQVANTALAGFFRRYLMQLAMSVFKWSVPETWDLDYLKAVLYSYGYVAVIDTEAFGPIPQQCGLGGYNVFYRPTTALIANPLLPSMELTIDTQCVVIKFQSDYRGILDLVAYYGNMMALCAETAGVNILNSKLSYVFVASNKAAAESMKKLYDQISSGNPMAVFDKQLLRADGTRPWEMFTQDVGGNYIAGDLLADLIKLENQFKSIIGIPNTNTEKRERLITSEVESNTVSTASRAGEWLERLKDGCARARDMFNIELDVNWRVPPEDAEGGVDDAGNN